MSDFCVETWWKVTYTNCITEGGMSGDKQWGSGYE